VASSATTTAWLTGRVIGEHYHGDFPVSTFLVNVSGALAIGYLSVLFSVDWRDRYSTALNAGVLTGGARRLHDVQQHATRHR
jgi:fluoride exporter